MELRIGGKTYTIEYRIEASLCNECTETVSNVMTDVAIASAEKNIKKLICGMSNIPQITLTMFYAGLLEKHGLDGDGTITSKDDAKTLVKKYFAENPESNFHDLMRMLMEQMDKDGFFKQIGLEQIAKSHQTKKPKTPQDHQKKQTKKVTEK